MAWLVAAALWGCTAGALGADHGAGDANGDRSGSDDPPPEDLPPSEDLLFGPATLDFALTLSDSALAQLPASADEPSHPVAATFRFAGESRVVGLTLKGGNGSFRRIDEKPSFRLDFAQYEHDGRFLGERYLVLNNLVQDQSMLAEHAAYFTWRAMGVPASRHGFARVTVNGEAYGLYGVVEDVHQDFLDRVWPDDADGPLLYSRGDLVPSDQQSFDVVEGDGRHPLGDMLDDLAAAGDDAFPGTLARWFDTEALLDEWAVEIATGNPDAYATRHNNYYVCWRGGADRWSMIPWGPDVAFTDALPLVADDFQGALYRRCAGLPTCRAELERHLAAVADWWETGALEREMEAVAARTEEDCVDDPRSEEDAGGCDGARAAFFAFLSDRPAELRAMVP